MHVFESRCCHYINVFELSLVTYLPCSLLVPVLRGGSPLMPMEAALSSLQMPELQESYTSVLRD